MSDKLQYKSFTTRRFRADLHYRLKLLAAKLGITMDAAFPLVVEEGLNVLEDKAQQAEQKAMDAALKG
jgi:hypothetical protein